MMILCQKCCDACFFALCDRREVEGHGKGEEGVLLAAGDEGLACRAGVVAVEGGQVEGGGGQAQGVGVGGRGGGCWRGRLLGQC